MGYKDKGYSKSLHQQMYDSLYAMLENGIGQSKKEDMKNGETDNKIYSYNTYKTYVKHCDYFVKWVKSHYKCNSLKKAKKYVNEYLQSRVEQGLSGYTIRTEAAALGKLYNIKPTDKDYFKCPERKRADIKRSRGDAQRDKHFSKSNNDELIKFCKGTGLRRSEMLKLTGNDYYSRDRLEDEIKNLSQEKDKKKIDLIRETLTLFPRLNHFVYIQKGKGGRPRIAPIIGAHTKQIVDRLKATDKDAKVWKYVNTNADIHAYRADYATQLYKEYARDIKDIPYNRTNEGSKARYQREVYSCRGDERGKKLDKRAMLLVSKALGHNRLDVMAKHYLRGI